MKRFHSIQSNSFENFVISRIFFYFLKWFVFFVLFHNQLSNGCCCFFCLFVWFSVRCWITNSSLLISKSTTLDRKIYFDCQVRPKKNFILGSQVDSNRSYRIVDKINFGVRFFFRLMIMYPMIKNTWRFYFDIQHITKTFDTLFCIIKPKIRNMMNDDQTFTLSGYYCCCCT